MVINEKYLTVNKFSRPGSPLIGVKGIVVHWVGNPLTTAEKNRNYFENLRFQNPNGDPEKLKWASAHFVIGLEGEIIQCLLEYEMGYHVGSKTYTPRALKELSKYPNDCTLGIELCHINWAGEFTAATLRSAQLLISELCGRYNLGKDNIYRHYDITGKDCPHYFVIHQDQWLNFLDTIF